MVQTDEMDEVVPVKLRSNVGTSTIVELGGKSDVGTTQNSSKSHGKIAVANRPASPGGLSHEMGPIESLNEVLGSSEVTEPPNKRSTKDHAQVASFEWHDVNKLFASELTSDEMEQGFKRLNRPNLRYLGFVPGRRDNRKYLNVLPLVTAQPGNNVACHLPVSTAQRWAMVVFVLMLALMGVGIAFYLRNVTLASSTE